MIKNYNIANIDSKTKALCNELGFIHQSQSLSIYSHRLTFKRKTLPETKQPNLFVENLYKAKKIFQI